MAANTITVTLNTAQNLTGPDALTSRFGTGSQAPSGVGFGGAAALAKEIGTLLDDFQSGPMPVTPTAANPSPPSITVVDGVTPATATVTFTGNGTAADTVTINGQALTAVASGAVANQWNVGTSTASAAANLLACINASTTAAAVRQTVFAYILPATPASVQLVCLFGGVIGNLVTLAKTSTSISAVSATLTGGAANTPLTVAH